MDPTLDPNFIDVWLRAITDAATAPPGAHPVGQNPLEMMLG